MKVDGEQLPFFLCYWCVQGTQHPTPHYHHPTNPLQSMLNFISNGDCDLNQLNTREGIVGLMAPTPHFLFALFFWSHVRSSPVFLLLDLSFPACAIIVL